MFDTLGYYYSAIRAAYPIIRRAVLTGQLWRPQCELTQPDPDILCDFDVSIPMPDGFTLKAHVFRSHKAQGQPLPVIMCAHPYDNNIMPALGTTPLKGPPQQYRLVPQEGHPRFSTITSWEAPDPNFWVPAGYVVVNLNLPGYGGSGGPPTVFTDQQAKAYYDAIGWVASQPWCNGSVGLNGVSFLAITQFHVAACQHYGGKAPPALKAISPWEGLTDIYRDQACPGGIEDEGFGPFWFATEVQPALTGTTKDFEEHNEGRIYKWFDRHPFLDDFWKEKTPKLSSIDVPMLVCASFSDHGLHTVGSFRAYQQAKSKHKYVYTHRGGKWDVYYSPEVQELTKQFMVRFFEVCFIEIRIKRD